MKKYFFIISALLLAIASYAQSAGSFKGKIIEQATFQTALM